MASKTGRMAGSVYYSDTMPKGTGDVNLKYDDRLYDLAELVYYNSDSVPADSVNALQQELLNIGYLDKDNPSSNDAMLGPMTRGAAYRYITNFHEEALKKSFFDSVKGIFGY